MCTVTWRLDQHVGYELFFGRDELRSRSRALPPRVLELDRIKVLSPTDPDGGGSWLTTNELALSVGLLNGSPGLAAPVETPRSRGKLVLDLASLSSAKQVLGALQSLDLSIYRPFTIFAIDSHCKVVVVDWDGEQLARRRTELPLLSSSSIDPLGALLARTRVLQAESEPDLHAFHRSHKPERGPHSPCMHRPDARTVSFSHISASPDTIRWNHVEGPPCSGRTLPEFVLPRSSGQQARPDSQP